MRHLIGRLGCKGCAPMLGTAKAIFTNKDARNNYFRVEETVPRANVSFSTGSGNDGIFKVSEIAGYGKTTASHELGHGLGLDHNNPSDWQSKIIGKPDIMDTRNDIVGQDYALPDGTLDINKREVSQKNIDNIFTPDVVQNLEKNGKSDIGKTTNTYYSPNGVEIKK
jgi:hypothetical protein